MASMHVGLTAGSRMHLGCARKICYYYVRYWFGGRIENESCFLIPEWNKEKWLLYTEMTRGVPYWRESCKAREDISQQDSFALKNLSWILLFYFFDPEMRILSVQKETATEVRTHGLCWIPVAACQADGCKCKSASHDSDYTTVWVHQATSPR